MTGTSRKPWPDVERTIRIPGGKLGLWIIAGGGIFGSLFAFVAGFAPPSDFRTWDTTGQVFYYVTLVGGFLLLASPPFLAQLVRPRLAGAQAGNGRMSG